MIITVCLEVDIDCISLAEELVQAVQCVTVAVVKDKVVAD
jgi:hypothetical protein